jgi:hypothetical protein
LASEPRSFFVELQSSLFLGRVSAQARVQERVDCTENQAFAALGVHAREHGVFFAGARLFLERNQVRELAGSFLVLELFEQDFFGRMHFRQEDVRVFVQLALQHVRGLDEFVRLAVPGPSLKHRKRSLLDGGERYCALRDGSHEV